MHSILDYIGSVVLGGIVFLALLNFYGSMNSSNEEQMMASIVQEDYTSATEVIAYDFRKIGFGSTDSVKVTEADTARIDFKGDVDANGAVDAVSYYLSNTPPSGAANTKRRTLYREVNGVAVPLLSNVTKLNLRYFDAAGAQTATLKNIKSLSVSMTLEADVAYNNVYPGISWERNFTPYNLR
jgi:Tfp pilus assembly protein PilW